MLNHPYKRWQRNRVTTATSIYMVNFVFFRKRKTVMLFWDKRGTALQHSYVNLNKHLIDEQCQHEK